jgi:glycosyltransferase involved in cell wall biosynthesis
MGYEVALAEPVGDFIPRRPFPHDLPLLRTVRSWLRKDDIVYCGHNVLYWIPFLRAIGLARRHIVSLLFALEPLDFSGTHSAVIALTPTAEQQARKLAPKAKIAHLGWGVDPASYPRHPYDPRYLLHCGIAGRDFPTLNAATKLTSRPLRLIAHGSNRDLIWPPNVEVVHSGIGYNHEEKKVTFAELVNVHYAGAAASLIITIANEKKDHALGFTNLIEALAMGLPIIQTRTGALADEIDVEQAGIGLAVPPEDPPAIAAAMETIMGDPARARAMAVASRQLCESHYNIQRYARELHSLFESF